MRLISILALAALVYSLDVAADSCEVGPTFWCENQDNAKMCNAVDYCSTYAWKTQSIEIEMTPIRSYSCNDCTKFVTSLKSFLTNESLDFAQDLIVDFLCRNMGQFRQQCESSVKSFIPSISRILIPLLDPMQTCRQAKLCQKLEQDLKSNSDNFDFSAIDLSEMQEDENDYNGAPRICTDCLRFMNGLKSLSVQFQPLIKDLMHQMVCPQFSGITKTECEMIGRTILPQVFGAIVKYFDPKKACLKPKICPKAEEGLIGSTHIENPIWNPDYEDSFPFEEITTNEGNFHQETKTCTDCKDFFKSLIQLLQKQTVTFVQDVILEQVCPRVGRFKQQCEELTKNYFPPTIKILLGMIDSQKTCAAMRVCPRQTMKEDPNREISDFEIQIDLIDFENMISILDQAKLLNKTACETCKQAFQFIRDVFKDQTLRATLQMIFGDIVCSLLGPVHIPCKAIVKTVIPLLFDAVSKLLTNPDRICRFIRACKSLEETVDGSIQLFDEPQDQFEQEVRKVSEPKQLDECLLCQRIAPNFFETAMAEQDDPDVFCQDLSEQEKTICVSMVKKFNPSLINRLSAVISPKFFCEKVRICPTVSDFARSNRGYSQKLGRKYDKVLLL